MNRHELLAVLLTACIAMAPAQARTASAAERAACEAKIRPRIDAIESRLRAGYSAREGESLRAQRRKLEIQLLRCREVR
jgi:hypothetical protein